VDNQSLAKKYDQVYRNGSAKFYSFNAFPESHAILTTVPDWRGLKVLEIGCGEGRLAALLSFAGAAQVEAIDYSEEAIAIAQRQFRIENVRFNCTDYRDLHGQYDVVILQGVLEHLDNPFQELAWIFENFVGPGGRLITSSPSFINPRGYIWMTLHYLFKAPMSLSDLHFLGPYDFEAFARERGLRLWMKTCDVDWGGGERLLIDFRKRLPNVLRDAGLDGAGVDGLLEWLAKALPYQAPHDYAGANMVYLLNRPDSASRQGEGV
jgi:2-polyprenyl-3-methyl-5-hydroxy-6-metoxy-1,4-benzoquinol methylase